MHTTMRKRGFTLIELLTVIAIIAVLAAIIFPVSATVREQARASDCMTKLHQLWVSANVYKQDEGAFPGVLLGYAETDGANLLPVDRILHGSLYNEQIKDINVFRCIDNPSPSKTVVTRAYFIKPAWTPPANGGQAVTWVGDVLQQQGCSDSVGPYDCFRESDGVLSGDPMYHQPKMFYVWDSYDIGPSIDPLTGQARRDGSGAYIYERHYSADWTGEINIATQGGSVSTKYDRTNQLQYANPPDDKTLFTYCTWHVAGAGSGTATVLNMGGSAKKITIKDLAIYGYNIFNQQ